MSVFRRRAIPLSSSKSFSLASKVAIVGASALVLSACAGGADDPAETTSSEDLTLKIGTILPQSGSLAFLGPPEEAGVQLAAEDIAAVEDAGITLDDIVWGDSGDLDNKAYEAEVPRVLGENVSAIIGAASSGVSKMFIDQVTDAGVIQFSPANTSADFTTWDDGGLFWRTAPSDTLQGNVLGNLIAADGHATLGFIVLNDAYGTGLAEFTTEAFEAAGGEVVATEFFNTGDTSFDAQISAVTGANPDAIALIAFDETKTIVPALGDDVSPEQLYFVDGNLADYSEDFEPGTLTGAKGTLPGLDTATLGDFTERLNDSWTALGNDDLRDFSYAAESYDAVVLTALAAKAAGATDGASIASKLQEVSGGTGDGTKCTTVADCFELLNAGETIDYDGFSGPITFDDNGDPTEATIGIFQYLEDNTFERIN